MTESSKIFAISDLHLPGGEDKSMDLFGPHWKGHFFKISQNWQKSVTPGDTVLIPGDISWAMRLEDAITDLQAIAELPGSKIIIKGNHDYWWSSISRVRESLPEGIHALQNDAVLVNDTVFCGTRGWNAPGSAEYGPEAEKIYKRELIRLELSLSAAQKLRRERRLVTLCHFPPMSCKGEDNEVTALLERNRVDDVVYGHLHGASCSSAFTGVKNGVCYWFTSCDCIDFSLIQLTG